VSGILAVFASWSYFDAAPSITVRHKILAQIVLWPGAVLTYGSANVQLCAQELS